MTAKIDKTSETTIFQAYTIPATDSMKQTDKAIIYRDINIRWIEERSVREEIIEYMRRCREADINRERLRLQSLSPELRDIAAHALTQIELRRRYAKKFPKALADNDFLFPSALSAEQATDEAIAAIHAHIAASLLSGCDTSDYGTLKGHPEERLALDMTAGLGMDAMAFASAGFIVTAIEADPLKAAALRHNASSFGSDKFTVHNTDSAEWLESAVDTSWPENEGSAQFSLIFADPARRGAGNARVYNPADCLPDIVGLQRRLLSSCCHLMVKHSPMLDITEATRLFTRLSHIYIISLRGECKEVLTVQRGDTMEAPASTHIECINLMSDGSEARFSFASEDCGSAASDTSVYVDPACDLGRGHYLYQPDAGVMKAMPWRAIAREYPELKKIAANTHLFAGEKLYDRFPGRIIRIERIIGKKDKATLKGQPYNVVCRNYFMKSAELERQLRTVAGDDRYIFAFRTAKGAVMLEGVRI